ncbi:MAG: hypothetical protein JXR66_13560 [Bacteroidales bacterium]|nr:hypothetical protein [Bacteroidales bacterium]
MGYIRNYISDKIADGTNIDEKLLAKEVKHIGSSVMDVYTGDLEIAEICRQIKAYLESNGLNSLKSFSDWAGTGYNDYRVVGISDTSGWTLKFKDEKLRFVHIFPARMSPLSFRVKGNTLKSALLYYILVGRDYITGSDLNKVRSLIGLPPVKNALEAEAITKMIEVLRV